MVLLIFLFIFLCIGFGILLNHRQIMPASAVDTALVFGSGVEWKARSRWLRAAELYRRGLTRSVIVSGGVPVPGYALTEAEWFRDQLVYSGIPADAIILENRATSTYENVAFTLPILKERGFRSVILVTSDFMSLRSLLTAKKAYQNQGMEIYHATASSESHWNAWTWWVHPEGWKVTGHEMRMLFRQDLFRYWFRTITTDRKEQRVKS